jgi:sulfate permease, SulP family
VPRGFQSLRSGFSGLKYFLTWLAEARKTLFSYFKGIMKLENLIPSIGWLKNYQKDWLAGDLSAGLTVGVMLIPQGMAYSMLAGLPPIYGLYASTIPLIIYGFLGTSRQLAVGPVAMVALLTAAGVGALAGNDPARYLQLAIFLALMVGLIQWSLGAFRLGFLVNFLSHPVISGFTSAAALLIGFSQLKHLLGIKLESTHQVYEILWEALVRIREVHLPTFLVGIGGMVLIILSRKIRKSLPGQLLAVIFGIVVVMLWKLDQLGVMILGEIPAGLPHFQLPALPMTDISALAPTAIAIALVSFMESIAVAKAIQAKHRNYRVESNSELRALGMANIVGSAFQSFPVTGGFSRTAVNDQAGAQTGLASMISALLIILTLLFLTPLFYYVPQAILASVIMVAVASLFDYQEAIHLWNTNRQDFFMLLVTFVATLTLGIEKGILIGVVLSLAMVIYKTSRPHIASLGQVPGTSTYRNVYRFSDLILRDDLLIVRVDAPLYFANLEYFRDSIEKMVAAKGDRLRHIVIDAESINSVDSSAVHLLDQMIDDFRKRGIELYFSDVKGPVRDAFSQTHLMDKIGRNRFFLNNQDAVNYIDAESKEEMTEHPYKEYTLQVNR